MTISEHVFDCYSNHLSTGTYNYSGGALTLKDMSTPCI